MESLSRRGRDLVKAARERPGAGDRDRIRAGLDVRLAALAAPAMLHPPAAPAALPGAAAAKVAGALGVGAKVIGGVLLVGFSAGVFVGRATAPSSAPAQVIEATTASVAAPEPAPTIDDHKPNNGPAPVVPPIATQVVASPPSDSAAVMQIAPKASRVSSDNANIAAPEPLLPHEPEQTKESPSHARSIAEETAELREAHAALRSGDANAALAKLDALNERFPSGALQEERRAARILALCAAGRAVEARAEADRFLAELPGSVQEARVRASCAFPR